MKHIFLAFALALLAVTAAPADNVRPKPLTLHAPAPPSRPGATPCCRSCKTRSPGNAVDHYRQAIKNMKQDAPPERDWYPSLDQWMAAPLKDFPRKEVRAFLKQCESAFREVEAAARSEQCNWGLTEKYRKRGFAALLPDIHRCAPSPRSLPCAFAMSWRREGLTRPLTRCELASPWRGTSRIPRRSSAPLREWPSAA